MAGGAAHYWKELGGIGKYGGIGPGLAEEITESGEGEEWQHQLFRLK
jgi:hypothetical protein